MDSKLRDAYEYLTPKDQAIVNCVILSLYDKEVQITKIVRDVSSLLNRDGSVTEKGTSDEVEMPTPL